MALSVMSERTKRGSESPYCQLNENERVRQKSPSRGFFFVRDKGMMRKGKVEGQCAFCFVDPSQPALCSTGRARARPRARNRAPPFGGCRDHRLTQRR